MSLEWRGSGAVGDGILISTLTAGSLPMMAKESPGFAYFNPNPAAAQGPALPLGANSDPSFFYYSTIGSAVSTIAAPSGSVLPLLTQANLSQPYFTQ